MNKNNQDAFDFMIDASQGWNASKKAQKETFQRAYELAVKAHEGQFRDEGTPYITHIDSILKIFREELEDLSFRKWTIIALHDVLEDSNYTYEDLKAEFSEIIADCVRALTKTKGMKIEQYLSNIMNSEYCHTLVKIKLADRLHNVRSLRYILDTNKNKVAKYIEETEKYYLPLAKKHNELLYKEICNALELLNHL